MVTAITERIENFMPTPFDPCNMVMMNEEGGADMIRGHPMIDNGESTPGEFSPATPKVIVSME
jgi:hypothetical protein